MGYELHLRDVVGPCCPDGGRRPAGRAPHSASGSLAQGKAETRRRWGEECDTYFYPERSGKGYESTSFQTAWAMLGLMAGGEAGSPEVRRGADYLIQKQRPDGSWEDKQFNAPAFPRIIYLKYHGYPRYFPLLVLARYRNMRDKEGFLQDEKNALFPPAKY